jgi:hypothetical protein
MVIAVLGASLWARSASADGIEYWRHVHHHHHHRYLRMREAEAYPQCYVGWWQTLRFGHVRPRWGAYCGR